MNVDRLRDIFVKENKRCLNLVGKSAEQEQEEQKLDTRA